MKTIIFVNHSQMVEPIGRVTEYTVLLKNGTAITHKVLERVILIPHNIEEVELISFNAQIKKENLNEKDN